MNITQEEALRRLSSPLNLAKLRVSDPVEVRPSGKQGQARQQNVPEPVRDIIATLAGNASAVNKKSGAHGAIAEAFGVSRQTVSAAMTGKVGGKPANEDRAAKRLDNENGIKDTALTKLMQSLNLMTEDKLDDLDAKGLASVATQMTKVYSGLTPVSNTGPQAQLIIYAPQLRRMDDFKVVEVTDNAL